MRSLFHKPQPESDDLTSFLHHHAGDISGSLCVFGDWFGRPHDNWHQLVSHEENENYLKLTFNEGETLEVWFPKDLKMEGKQFLIQHAKRVRWEWFYYGRPYLPENRFFEEHVMKDGVIETSSNATWYSPDFKPSLTKPAVSIQ